MDYDLDKVDDMVLALLLLTQHDTYGAWKGYDWDVMNRLHEKGFISNPRGRAKSIMFTQEGLERSTQLFEQYFAKPKPEK